MLLKYTKKDNKIQRTFRLIDKHVFSAVIGGIRKLIRTEAEPEADLIEYARIPVIDDDNVENELSDTEHVWIARTRVCPVKELLNPSTSQDSIQSDDGRVQSKH